MFERYESADVQRERDEQERQKKEQEKKTND